LAIFKIFLVKIYVYIASYKAYLERKKLEEAEAKQKKAEEEAAALARRQAGKELEEEGKKLLSLEDSVTKVTFHLPPTATHLLGEWTLPSHALVLCSSEALHLFQ